MWVYLFLTIPLPPRPRPPPFLVLVLAKMFFILHTKKKTETKRSFLNPSRKKTPKRRKKQHNKQNHFVLKSSPPLLSPTSDTSAPSIQVYSQHFCHRKRQNGQFRSQSRHHHQQQQRRRYSQMTVGNPEVRLPRSLVSVASIPTTPPMQ